MFINLSHSVNTPSLFCWMGGIEPPTNFFFKVGGLTGSEFSEGGGELLRNRARFLYGGRGVAVFT